VGGKEGGGGKGGGRGGGRPFPKNKGTPRPPGTRGGRSETKKKHFVAKGFFPLGWLFPIFEKGKPRKLDVTHPTRSAGSGVGGGGGGGTLEPRGPTGVLCGCGAGGKGGGAKEGPKGLGAATTRGGGGWRGGTPRFGGGALGGYLGGNGKKTRLPGGPEWFTGSGDFGTAASPVAIFTRAGPPLPAQRGGPRPGGGGPRVLSLKAQRLG